MNQIDLFAAREARDEALALVAGNSDGFISAGLELISRLPRGDATGEDIRFALEAKGLIPHHHNAWGALTLAAVKRGLLRRTDRFVNMRGPKSHARMTRVYIINGAV